MFAPWNDCTEIVKILVEQEGIDINTLKIIKSDIFQMDIDNRCVNALRVLAMDTIHKANSGHSGTPLGLAPATHTIWSSKMWQS